MGNLADIRPEPCERAAIFGKTGSGKTKLAEHLLASFKYVVCYDAKGRLGLDKQGKRVGWPGFVRLTKLADVIKSKHPRIIYAPTAAELRSDATINAFFEWVYKRGNTVCYVDELTAVTNRTQLPTYFHDCLVRGRELGITMIISSQRPKDIPPNIIESAERFYVFRVKMPQDVKRIQETTGLLIDFVRLPKHEFWYVTEEGERRGPLMLDLKRAA